jgi:peroxiredoxin
MISIRRAMMLVGAVACLAAALLIVVAAGLPQRAAFTGYIIPGELPVAPEVSAVAPPFEAVKLDSQWISLGSLRGQAVLINFWATWCEPCRVEMPDLEAIHQKYRERGLRVLAVNLGEPPELIQQWIDEFGLTFDILLDEQQEIAALYYIRGQPTTYVISPEGIVVHIFYGATNREALEAAIAPFF